MMPTILTAEGHEFSFLTPGESRICIEDIAHALAHICRFTGHTRDFYSVAQHSVLVSYAVPEAFAFQGLMHDAHEAYVGDLAAPLKMLLPEYRAVEKRVEGHVRRAFGLPAELDPSVKHADLQLLATEQRDLMPLADAHVWTSLQGIEPLQYGINALPPMRAYALFMDRFEVLQRRAG